MIDFDAMDKAEIQLRNSLLALNSNSKSEIVAEAIIKKIQTGEFMTGEKLPSEHVLSTSLGVGRSTIREAVKQLVCQNILEIKRGRGTFVSSATGVPADPFGFRFRKDKLQLGLDLCEIRLMIEPTLAMNAALRATNEQVERIVEAQDEVTKFIRNGWHHEESDIKFHCTIAACTENVILKELTQIIISGIPYLINITNRRLCVQAAQTHQMVVKAILKKDGKAAANAMQLHITQNRDDLLERIANSRE